MGTDTFGIFGVTQFGIGIGVESADQSNDLSFSGVVVIASEEGAQVDSIDVAIVVQINRSPAPVHGPVMAGFELLAESFSSVVEVDLQLKESGNVVLNVTGEFLVSTDVVRGSLGDGGSEVGMIAREEHLEELGVGESAVIVRVEEFDELVAFSFTSVVVSVVSEEINKFARSDVAVSVSVDALEGSVGLELVIFAEALPVGFNSLFSSSDFDQEVFKDSLGHCAKHFAIFFYI